MLTGNLLHVTNSGELDKETLIAENCSCEKKSDVIFTDKTKQTGMESFKRAKHVNRRDTIPIYPPIHRDVRLTRCESCCRIFTNKDDLKHHVALTHTGRKPHACAVCGKRYGQLQHLKSHYKLHREARLQVWHTKFTSGTGNLLCENC